MENKTVTNKMMTYKGKPLVRKGNTIYYGNMSDAYVAMLTIKKSKDVDGLDIATDVLVQVISTNLDVPADKLVIKFTQKNGLYPALRIADIWLSRENGWE